MARDLSTRGGSRPPVLASDAERERAVDKLRAHHAAGRLDLEELEQRVAAAYAASHRTALRALFADLPRTVDRPSARAVHRAAVRFHATGYLGANGAVIAAWAATGAGEFWPGYVLAPTTAMLAAHALGLPWAVRALRRRGRRRR
jgi:hypothetical protein